MQKTILAMSVLLLTSVSFAAPRKVTTLALPTQQCKYYEGNKLVDGGSEVRHTSDYILGCNDGGGKGDCQAGGEIKLSHPDNSCCHCITKKK